MNGVLAALLAGLGVAALALPAPSATRRQAPLGTRTRRWARQAGLGDTTVAELVVSGVGALVVGAGVGWVLFGGVVAPVVAGVLAIGAPAAAIRRRRQRRRDDAAAAWPHLLEEARLNATTLGRSIPRALFDTASSAPPALAGPLSAAERTWMVTGDFARALDVLRDEAADATADVVAETLLVADDVGTGDVGARLGSLAHDRQVDARHRSDARARQAGARFARWFVLVVPLGMALVGLTIGDGRAAYGTSGGQATVAAALVALASCWWWSGRLMRLPDDDRVIGR